MQCSTYGAEGLSKVWFAVCDHEGYMAVYMYAHAYRYVGFRVLDIAMRDPYDRIYKSTIRVMKA